MSAKSAGRKSIACTAVPDRRELAQGALLVSDLDGTVLRPDGTLGWKPSRSSTRSSATEACSRTPASRGRNSLCGGHSGYSEAAEEVGELQFEAQARVCLTGPGVPQLVQEHATEGGGAR